jgi:5-methylcytosine-specific restriction endonuclease McrBC GTP-binding regulatory subunit McrB
MMAKIEEILNNWKWDEEKIAEYLEKFKEYLSSSEGKKELEIRNEKKLKIQKFLEDEESIDKLSTEELKELLLMVNTIRTYEDKLKPKERPITSEIDKGNIEYINQIKDWLKRLIKIKEGDSLPNSPKHCSAKAASELLTFRYPEKFYIVNGASIKGLNELRLDNITELNESNVNENNYPNWRPLFEYLKDKISKVIKDKLDKKTDYYDVDLFLYFISEQNRKSKKKKTDENQNKDKDSANNAETDKESNTKNELTLHEYFQYNGFYFDQALIKAFYSALKTKGFVILSGLTGTGKTKLAQLFAELLCPNFEKHFEIENTKKTQDEQNTQIAQNSSENQNQCNCTHLFLPVRPDWRDTKALLGYYNPITGKYESTPLLDFILKAMDDYNKNKNNASPYFIILDEMNLSHVEYYFADFLSVLESGRDENYWTKETIKLHNSEKPLLDNNGKEIPKEVKLPPNLYIIGSVNIDETTYMFSPKVLDRAFTIEFREVNFDSYNPFEIDEEKAKSIGKSIRNILLEDLINKENGQARFSGAVADKEEIKQARFCGAVADKKEIKEALNCIKENENKVKSGNLIINELKELHQKLQPYNLHFGYRVLDEIALFIKYATKAPDKVGKLSPEDALDFAILMKVLPKFHGPRQKLERPLWLVLNWCLGNKFDNKKFEELIKGIWKELNGEDKRPSIEDFTYVIQKLKSELNNRSKKQSQEAISESQTIGETQNQPTEESPESTSKVSQEANSESQTIDENQNQTSEESPESTSEAHQTEQTSKNEKATNIDKVKYPRTAIKVLTMLRQLYETGFTSFA